jgi:hypothetical protein
MMLVKALLTRLLTKPPNFQSKKLAFSTWPDGNLSSSQLIEHRGVANATCLHFAVSGLSSVPVVIHSFSHGLASMPTSI